MKLQKVLNQTADDFYAHEVFEIAKSQNMKLIDAFEQYKNNYLRILYYLRT
ncbi:conserved hypothetical protein [Sphingobacterium multivorum]|uniref:Uncharacterized protein n=1 Tax=Sphingobacterium multivorum TaxID=28454 RepID=A0A654B7U8_SPHMU|nr:conserved hypothetical protein [Sphingobacterium multivorum]